MSGNGTEVSVGLLDFGPASSEVSIRKQKHPVYGLSALSVFDLIKQYPEVRAILEQRFKDITPERLMAVGPIVALRIGAMGLLNRAVFNDEKSWTQAVEDGARKIGSLSIGDQIKILNAVLSATMPDGRDPFIEELNQVKALFSGSDATSAPSTNSQEDSVGLQ